MGAKDDEWKDELWGDKGGKMKDAREGWKTENGEERMREWKGRIEE